MYKDPITPRAYPHLLQEQDYDPFRVMPSSLPVHPSIATTEEKIRQCRVRLANRDLLTVTAWQVLQKNCPLDAPTPPVPEKPDANTCQQNAHKALRYALAGQIDPNPAYRNLALHYLQVACRTALSLTFSGFDMDLIWNLAAAADVLMAGGLVPADKALVEEVLRLAIAGADRNPHVACNNQSSFHMLCRLSAGAALGDRQVVHDALYGCEREGRWRYGLIHLLRHDFLSDGMQWEGAIGYHMLVMLSTTEMLRIMEHLGVDLWRRPWMPLMHDDGFDEHRGYGPKGAKCFKAAFDAFFYQAYSNGDYALLHDQILGNIRGTHAWASLFNKAYEVYGDPKYAWLLTRMRKAFPESETNPLPIWFHNGRGDIEFLRLTSLNYPAGHFSFDEDAVFSLTGRHVNGCSLFPVHGSAVLRAKPAKEDSLDAYFYFGPHWNGHRSPAALHLDLHARRRRISTAPSTSGGYSDGRHLTWNRTTIAHNTVTVDETPMFPYDFDTDSYWECDLWRDRISDGKLEFFQPDGKGFKAVRGSNDNVYEGVTLDRTVILTSDTVLDVYRVISETPHQYDWAMHCPGRFITPLKTSPIVLGEKRGYRHFSNIRRLATNGPWVPLTFKSGPLDMRLHLMLPSQDTAIMLADDPEIINSVPIIPERRHTVLMRTNAAQALFVAFWTIAPAKWQPFHIHGDAETDVSIEVKGAHGFVRWELPFAGPVERTARRRKSRRK